jgi:hypothetical protein
MNELATCPGNLATIAQLATTGRNPARIPPFTATGRNLPTEILFALSGAFLSGRRSQMLIAVHSLSVIGAPMASS